MDLMCPTGYGNENPKMQPRLLKTPSAWIYNGECWEEHPNE